MERTPNYQLNQWSADDRVLRTDFNADNAKIDTALRANAAAIATERSERVAAIADGLRLAVGSYEGTGSASRTLDLSRSLGKPVRVLAILANPLMFLSWPDAASSVVSWSADTAYGARNETGHTYHYFALG